MSNAKRFLSVILAIIMVCSTLVIGANALYYGYKNEAITTYNKLDEPVLTTEQYASAAMDEVDRMLNEEQLEFTREDIVVGDVSLKSINDTMDSVYALVHGSLFQSLKGMLGDLGNLNVEAFKGVDAGGVRRSEGGTKSDLDIIYAVLQFLYDNKGIFVDFLNQDINLGTILPSLVDISEYQDVNKLLKGLLYEATYVDENGDSLDAPDDIASYTIDGMVQDLIDRYVVDEFTIDHRYIGGAFKDHTDISTGTFYSFLDSTLEILYNAVLVPELNGSIKREVGKLCGITYEKQSDGTYIEDRSGINSYAQLLNVDYVVPEYNFEPGSIKDQLNNMVKSISDVLVNPDIFVWEEGTNAKFRDNVANLAKAALVNTGNDFFASYIEVATPDEVEAMSTEELTAYALRAIINGSVDGMYIPEEAKTIREFGYYTLKQLLATSVPALDFSAMDKNSTETIFIMGIDYAIYSVNAQLDMGLEYVYTMDGVEQQLAKAAQYAIDNYGGLFNGIDFTDCKTGWDLFDAIIFRIIDVSWLPSAANGTVKGFLMDCVLENILNLNFEGLFDIFETKTSGELVNSPKQVVINRLVSIFNTIFPNAFPTNATKIGDLVTNSALAGVVESLFSTLYNCRANLTASILPTLCGILDLTNKQEFEFPKLTYENRVLVAPDVLFDVSIRNNSSGINTGYTYYEGNVKKFKQDSLYSYEIDSITSSLSGISIAAGENYLTSGGTLEAGETKKIHVTGSLSTNEELLKITIKYNVTTEDGSYLTAAPIEEDVYVLLTKTASDEETTLSSAAAGGFAITKAPANVYATSMSDITDITLTVANTNDSKDVDLTPASDLLNSKPAFAKRLADADGNCYFELNTEPVAVMKQVYDDKGKAIPGVGRIQVFNTTAEYKALSREEKDAAWEALLENLKETKKDRYGNITVTSYPKTEGYTLGVTNGTATSSITSTSSAKKTHLFLYNDYGLDSVVNSELTKHRQASAYESTDAWAAYQTALADAVKAVYSPFVATTFANATSGKAMKYETASANLETAIEALEETAKSAGVDDLQEIIDGFNPDNGELEYDDPAYNYFGVADFVDYTYYNYRDEYKAAQKMIDRATIPNEETGEVQAINELDKTYIKHRLELYGSRLLPNTPVKTHLAAELASYTRTDIMTRQNEWTQASWDNFQRALTFAQAVNGDTTVTRQSKVDTAYEELLEAEKRLVADGGAQPTEPDYDVKEGAAEVVETAGEKVLTGITPSMTADQIKALFALENCTAEVTPNASGKIGTGAVVEIKDGDGNVLASYTLAVYTDANGDNDISAADVSYVSAAFGGSKTPTAEVKVAIDVKRDNDITAADVSRESAFFGGSATPDYAACDISK